MLDCSQPVGVITKGFRMELKLQRNQVLQELSILQGVVEHRTTIPILSSILTEAAENSVRRTLRDPSSLGRGPSRYDGYPRKFTIFSV